MPRKRWNFPSSCWSWAILPGAPMIARWRSERPINIDKDNFNEVLKAQNISLNLTVPNRLSGKPDEEMSVKLQVESMKDFDPEAVAEPGPGIEATPGTAGSPQVPEGPDDQRPGVPEEDPGTGQGRNGPQTAPQRNGDRRIRGEILWLRKRKRRSLQRSASGGTAASLLEEIVQATKLKPTDEAYSLAEEGGRGLNRPAARTWPGSRQGLQSGPG